MTRGRRTFAGIYVTPSESHLGPLWVKLASAGVRPTRQRLELADILFGKGERHFTAEMIHAEARALRYPPSLGTIYNTLNQFVQNGLLREIALYDSKLWYDTNTGPHCHYYWEDTDEISDIPAEHVPSLQVPPPEGARVTAIDVIVRVRSDGAERECPMAKFEKFLK
jgi:Fur family iron response transcriptional regulator